MSKPARVWVSECANHESVSEWHTLKRAERESDVALVAATSSDATAKQCSGVGCAAFWKFMRCLVVFLLLLLLSCFCCCGFHCLYVRLSLCVCVWVRVTSFNEISVKFLNTEGNVRLCMCMCGFSYAYMCVCLLIFAVTSATVQAEVNTAKVQSLHTHTDAPSPIFSHATAEYSTKKG